MAGHDALFGPDKPPVSVLHGLESLARYAVAVLRQPEAVRQAGWTLTALLTFAAQRLVESAPADGARALSFDAIQKALASASAEMPPMVNPPESTQNLAVLLPLLLMNSQKRRLGRQASEASARMEVIATTLGAPQR